MLALYQTLGLRYLRKRRPRAVLVVLSIALGVATWIATGALNDSLKKAVHQTALPLGGLADLFVGNGENGVALSLRKDLAAVPGVKAVRPLVFERVQLPVQPDGKLEPALFLGVEVDASMGDASAWGLEIEASTLVNYLARQQFGQQPAVIGEALNKSLIIDADERFKVSAAGKTLELRRVGTMTAHGPAATLGGSVVAMDCNQAARLLGHPDLVTRLDLTLEPDADRENVREAVVAALAGRAEVQTPEEASRRVGEVIGGIEIGVLLAGAGALIVGTFLVYNAMAVSVAERRHDVGILRSIGATRHQVRGLFVLETLVLGSIGTLLGVPLGRALIHFMLGPMSDVLHNVIPAQVREVEIGLPLVAGAMAAGLLTALLSALVPATRAAAEEPADAVRRVPPSPGLVFRLLQLGSAASFVVAGSLAMALKDRLPSRMGTYAGFVLIGFGALLVTPILAAFIARLVQPLARQFLPLPARLAADNLVREPGRTGVVIAALAAGVALMFETAGVILSNREAILDWADRTITSDLIVTAGGAFSSGGSSMPMDDSVGDRIARTFPGSIVSPVRFRYVSFRTAYVQLEVMDARSYYEANQRNGHAPPELAYYRRLADEPGTALISDNFASIYGVRPGDVIALPASSGPRQLKVIGTYDDPSWPRGTVVINRIRKFEPGEIGGCLALGGGLAGWRLKDRKDAGDFDGGLADYFDVYLPPGTDAAAAREHLQQLPWAADESLIGVTRPELRGHIGAMVEKLSDLTFSQRLMIGLVAALGVLMALLISVLQRRRELGLLRAAGATRWQVLWAVLAEAILMGAIGIVIGVVVGIPVEWYVIRIVLFEEGGFLFPVRIPWLDGAVIAALSLAVAAVAGLWPAVQATRLRIADAIAYE